MIVSRSGQIRKPCKVMSSAVLAITVSSAVGYPRRTPSTNFEPPTPPAKITICTALVFHQREVRVGLPPPFSLLARRPGELVPSSHLAKRGIWIACSGHGGVPLIATPITSGRLPTLAEVQFLLLGLSAHPVSLR